VPRVDFLQPLLSETLQILHRALTTSAVLHVPLFQQPFHRHVSLSLPQVRLLSSEWESFAVSAVAKW
jgi:hypothetical protein